SIGIPHLGNYFGALKSWSSLQERFHKNYFCVVDLHALTVLRTPGALLENIKTMIVSLLACGIDPQKSVIFQQSMVPHHCELLWILCCFTSLSSLKRMTQFKAQHIVYSITLKSTRVPVGDDQRQHIEFARDLAISVNYTFSQKLFSVPEGLYGSIPRLRDLRNPAVKMSKTAPSSNGCINLTDSDDEISAKIRMSFTDCEPLLTYDLVRRPGVANLINIYSACTGKSPSVVCEEFRDSSMREFKEAVVEAVIHEVAPIRKQIGLLKGEEDYIRKVLEMGRLRAEVAACQTVTRVKKVMGLLEL
ncbi:tryptophan--tRNA ligase, mitochondrial-like, partial [Zophobas morio]|uniref:tryptophan--tRNA ligase, mitochondrial-like n=1 Tax=Zophobas morio TaxID=2755281 RepID=UPI003082B805